MLKISIGSASLLHPQTLSTQLSPSLSQPSCFGASCFDQIILSCFCKHVRKQSQIDQTSGSSLDEMLTEKTMDRSKIMVSGGGVLERLKLSPAAGTRPW